MSRREGEIATFLAACGWAGADRAALAGDASFRRYERLSRGGASVVLMDAPPAAEDIRPFLVVAAILAGHAYSAPRVIAADAARGLALLEDLGDDVFTRVLAAGGDERALYAIAVDLLIDLHRRPLPEAALPPYDESRLQAEADLLLNWFLPAAAGRPVGEGVRAAWRASWEAALPLARRVPEALVLRDYHADNLIWLPRRQELARVGLLDFQDAVIGPGLYDLVSLIEDARRDLDPGVADAMIARYRAAFPEIAGADFADAYAVLGAQRNAKIVGIFTRLAKRDGKPRYLDALPRVWRHLEGDLAHPGLAPVAAWFAAQVPPSWRGRTPWAA